MPNRIRSIPLVTPLLMTALLVPAALPAQYATSYGPVVGSRVRVTAPTMTEGRAYGSLLAFGADSLVLDMSGRATVRLPVSALTRVEVSDGPDRGLSALRGGAIGAIAGGVLGTVGMRREDGLARLVGSIVGSGMGLFIGAAVGGFTAPERWRAVWTAPSAP
jgi:hypothetical protein